MSATSQLNTEKFTEFAKPLVESGRYNSANEVLSAAMDALLREECDEKAKQRYLENALDEAEASGIFQGDIFESIGQELGWGRSS